MLTSREDRLANYRNAQQGSGSGQMSTYGVMQRETLQDNPRERTYNTLQRRYSGDSQRMMSPDRNPNARSNSMMSQQRDALSRYMGGARSFGQPEPTMQRPQGMGGFRGYQPTRSRIPMQPQNTQQRLGGSAQNQRMMYDGSMEDFINSR